MDNLLQQARIAKANADNERALIDQLPELERQAQKEKQQAQMAQGKAKALELFNEALIYHKAGDSSHEAIYSELRASFRSFVSSLKSDNQSYQKLWQAALKVGYYLASDDEIFGLSADSQRHHAEQVLIDHGVKPVELPVPKDAIDQSLNDAIIEALNA